MLQYLLGMVLNLSYCLSKSNCFSLFLDFDHRQDIYAYFSFIILQPVANFSFSLIFFSLK